MLHTHRASIHPLRSLLYLRPVYRGLSGKSRFKNMSAANPKVRPSAELSDNDTDLPVEKKQRLMNTLTGMLGYDKQARTVARNRRKKQNQLPDLYSPADVVYREALSLLGKDIADNEALDDADWEPPFEKQAQMELTVSSLSSTGDSLSVAQVEGRSWVIATPHALPHEKIRVRVYKHSRLHSYADLLEVITPNEDLRDMNRVKCKYFGKCAGCQYQMLAYDTQLDLKRDVIVKAYKTYSDLPISAVPNILPTVGSPLQYGYRTKITPHFDSVPKRILNKGPPPTEVTRQPDWLKIGFNQVSTRKVMDIEDCPIASPIINNAYGPLRKKIIQNIYSYKRGVSLLLRESSKLPPTSESSSETNNTSSVNPDTSGKICVTDHKSRVREFVGDKIFEYGASSFFQNNNSVLLPLTSYTRDMIFPPSLEGSPRPTHLVDAYCGSGLFAITLSPHFEKVVGIEVASDAIKDATTNAVLNNLPDGKCRFIAGDAADIFSVVSDFPRERTALVIDPSRKGSDERFINQLIDFGCSTVVYVSCNVHTQARDIGMILRMAEERMDGRKYVVESIRGFDLFPQTAHVESVAVLRLV